MSDVTPIDGKPDAAHWERAARALAYQLARKAGTDNPQEFGETLLRVALFEAREICEESL